MFYFRTTATTLVPPSGPRRRAPRDGRLANLPKNIVKMNVMNSVCTMDGPGCPVNRLLVADLHAPPDQGVEQSSQPRTNSARSTGAQPDRGQITTSGPSVSSEATTKAVEAVEADSVIS